MNGDVLKKVFLIIVATLCLIVVVLTVALFFNFKVDDYKQILEILGAPALLSMIITSFIHSNIKDAPIDADAQVKKITETTTTSEVTK